MSLTEHLPGNGLVVSALAIILTLVVLRLQDVGPRRAIALDRLRTLVWRLLEGPGRRVLRSGVQRLAAWRGWDDLADWRLGRPLVRDKTGSDDYIVSVDGGLLAVARALWGAGYRWNPMATAKYRRLNGRRQWALLSAAWRESATADTQHHVYIFRGTDGALDIYGHREASVTEPGDHDGGDELVPGDPGDRLPVEVLREARQ